MNAASGGIIGAVALGDAAVDAVTDEAHAFAAEIVPEDGVDLLADDVDGRDCIADRFRFRSIAVKKIEPLFSINSQYSSNTDMGSKAIWVIE